MLRSVIAISLAAVSTSSSFSCISLVPAWAARSSASGLIKHCGKIGAELAYRPADGVARGGLIQVVSLVYATGCVMIVGGLVKTVEAKDLRFLALNGTQDPYAHPLVVKQVSML